jgi:hypothetical protein
MTPSERYQAIIGNLKFLAGKGASNEELNQYLNYEELTFKDLETLLEGPSLFGQAKEVVKGIPAGAVGLVEEAAIGASALLPEDMEAGAREVIESTATTARKPFAPAVGYEETVGRKLGEAGGSFIPFLATLPFGLPGVAAALGLGVGAGAGEARTRAEQEGATEEQRATATALGTIPGAFELFAPFRILRRIPEGEVISGAERVKRAFIAGGEEGAQEAASAVAQNLIAREVYKPSQELIEGVGEQAAYGGAVGAIAQGLFDLAIPGKQRGAAPSPTQPAQPAQLTPTPVGVPAEAQQLGLFSEEEIPVALTPDEGAYAIREESMMDEARRQQALVDADTLRNEFDTLQRENERLAAAFGRATTDEEKAKIKKEAERIAPALESLKKELQKTERKLPKEERGRATAPPEQMALDFEAPLMERRKTGEGVVLGEGPEAAPETLTPEQQTFFQESQLQGIRDRIAEGEPVTDADRARLRLAEQEQRQIIEATPTPEITMPEERPEARPPFGLQRTDIEQPSAAPREPITVTPEGEAIIGRPEVEERRVSEDDFTQMGIGKTNKKLRELLIGKDLANPTQREEVRAALEDFANAPNRSEKLRTGVENFLSQPMFMEQMGLDLQPRREPDDRGPTGLVGPRGKPSVPPPSAEEAASTGVEPSVTEGVGALSDVSGVPDAGEGVQPDPIRQKQRKDFGKAIGAVDTGILRGRKNPQLARAMEAGDSRSVLDILSESKNPIYRWLANKAKAIPSLKFKVGDETETSRQNLDADIQNALISVAELELMRKAKPEVDASPGDTLPNLGKYFQDTYLGKKEGIVQLSLDNLNVLENKQAFNERLASLEEVIGPNIDRIKAMADFMGQRMEVAGSFDPATNTVSAVDIFANREDVVAHEIGHALTAQAIKNPNVTQKPIVQKLKTLYETVKDDPLIKDAYGATSLDEFVAEGWSNPEFQLKLSQIKYEATTAWGKFTEYVAKLLGLKKNNAFVEFMALGENLVEGSDLKVPPSKKFVANARKAYMDQRGRNDPAWAQLSERQKNDWYDTYEMDSQESRYESAPKLLKVEKMPITPEGQAILNTIEGMGRKYEAPPKGYLERIKKYWNNEKDNPTISPETSRGAVTRWLDQVQTWTFSADAALNNEIRRQVMDSTKSNQDKIGALLNISMSQTVHDDALGNLILTNGRLEFDPETYKYVAVNDKSNFVTLAGQIQQIASQYGLTVDQTEAIGHIAFEARRLKGLREFNERVRQEVDKLNSQNRKAAAERRAQDIKFIHMTDQQIDTGMTLFDKMPELNQLVETWNGMRNNTRDVMVNSGLWSVEEANSLLANADYVPFTREEQIEDGRGPKEFLSGLQVNAREKKLKGTLDPVNDVFDNMARWTQYAIKRAVRNRNAVALVDTAVENGLAKKVDGPTRSGNTVKVWRDGNEEFYDMADPMYMEAFKGLEPVAIPALKVMAKFANFLRQSVVLYPLFSVAQVPQDAYAAMFSSGLKTRFALTIPARTVKEFIKTLANSSRTNAELKQYGVVGIRDFTSAVARMDAEIYSGLKEKPGFLGSLKRGLEHIAMASDNAVRQAVYEASMAQGLTKAEALEKAFEIINFRRRGSSQTLGMMAQVIPFFNAYLSAQNVVIKTVSGVGISPGDRAAALRTLAATTGTTMALSLIYSMLVSDDEDYLDKPSVIRDRLLMIPGTGGLSVPIRPDIFSIPKILTEHTYLMMTNNGTEDGRKFRDSMRDAVVNALSSPTAIPQVVKPAIEVAVNYNFFQGRPLIGTYQQNLELGRQFNDSTSELAKALGSTNLVSPVAVDHIIRGMLGTTGSLLLYLTNGVVHNDPMVPRPELSLRDAVASFPGMSPFVSREYGTALKNDFYVLREDVDRAVDTFNDLKRRSPQEILEFLADEKKINRLGMARAVNKISDNLSEIRRAISQVTNATGMNAQQKREMIKQLRDLEKELLKSVDLKQLRRIAQL